MCVKNVKLDWIKHENNLLPFVPRLMPLGYKVISVLQRQQ